MKQIQGKPQPRVKLKSVSFYKKKAWKLFSELIRRAHANPNGMTQCVTCRLWFEWKKLQAGHFIPGRHNSILFDERGVHPQCMRCNVFLRSNPREYDAFMRKTYGAKVIKELERKDKELHQFTRQELMALIETYKDKLETLK